MPTIQSLVYQLSACQVRTFVDGKIAIIQLLYNWTIIMPCGRILEYVDFISCRTIRTPKGTICRVNLWRQIFSHRLNYNHDKYLSKDSSTNGTNIYPQTQLYNRPMLRLVTYTYSSITATVNKPTEVNIF